METTASKVQGRTVKLHNSTLDRINGLKHKGQTYDGVINELLDFHDSHLSSNHNQPPTSMVKSQKTRGNKEPTLIEGRVDA